MYNPIHITFHRAETPELTDTLVIRKRRENLCRVTYTERTQFGSQTDSYNFNYIQTLGYILRVLGMAGLDSDPFDSVRIDAPSFPSITVKFKDFPQATIMDTITNVVYNWPLRVV